MTPDSTQRTASAATEVASRLTTDQRLTLRALVDAGAGVGERSADLETLRAQVADLIGSPISRQRLRRVLYELGASSVRYAGAAARVHAVSPGRRLIESSGGHGGTSARQHRLTPFAGEVLAAATQAQEEHA